MPTFFARRYMRGRPPVTEVVVGLGVLLLTAGIVVAFVVTARPSEEKLFVVRSGHEPADASPRELRAAIQMMPTLPGWQPWKSPSACRPDKLEAWLDKDAELFRSFDVAMAYQGNFQKASARTMASIRIFDMREPPNAFGVCAARMPAGAGEASLGRGGWTTKDRIGFWNGRYYTEVGGTDAAEADVADVARAVAAIQLAYGGPFAADGILPKENRVPRSFRYIAKDAFGLDPLDKAFVADYADGTSAFVIDAASLTAAEAIVGQLRERLAAGGATPAKTGTRGAAGRIGEREWLVASNGTHVFGTTGKAGADLAAVVTKIDAELGAAAAPVAAASAGGGSRNPLFPEIPGGGWAAPTAIKRFNRDTLYEKINGKAGVFLGYEFQELQFGVYQNADAGWSFDVYLYDMGQPANAFGIYRTEQSADAAIQPIGREGYLSAASAFFWKGKYYVNVLGPPDDAAAARGAEQIAAGIADAIADDGKPFWAETFLPKAGQRRNSFSYKATDAMGYSFLRNVFVAEYETGGKRYQLFIHRAADDAAGKALFEQYAEAVKQYNKNVTRRAFEEGEMIASESLGVYEIGFRKALVFGGVTECEDLALAIAQAEAFFKTIDASQVAAESQPPAPASGQETKSDGEGESYGEQ